MCGFQATRWGDEPSTFYDKAWAMNKIRLLLVEDDKLLREGILEILKSQKDIKVVAASSNKENTILKIHKLKPNVVLLDLGLRSQMSLQVVKMVKLEFPDAKVIVMDLAPAPADIAQFVKAGASGFILKDVTVDQFLRTIRKVAEGSKVLPPLFPESLFSQIVEYALMGGVGSPARITKQIKQIVKRSVKSDTLRVVKRAVKRKVKKVA